MSSTLHTATVMMAAAEDMTTLRKTLEENRLEAFTCRSTAWHDQQKRPQEEGGRQAKNKSTTMCAAHSCSPKQLPRDGAAAAKTEGIALQGVTPTVARTDGRTDGRTDRLTWKTFAERRARATTTNDGLGHSATELENGPNGRALSKLPIEKMDLRGRQQQRQADNELTTEVK